MVHRPEVHLQDFHGLAANSLFSRNGSEFAKKNLWTKNGVMNEQVVKLPNLLRQNTDGRSIVFSQNLRWKNNIEQKFEQNFE
jgi:hypothetical protein